MSRAEPEIPSIHTPLAHEQHVREHHERELDPPSDPEPIEHHPRHVREANDARPTPDLSARPAPDERGDDNAAVVSVLGPRPEHDDPSLPAWQRGAATIERYRSQYNLTSGEPALGAEPPAGKFEQRLDRRRAAAELLDAPDQVGRSAEYEAPTPSPIRRAPRLTRDELEPSNGWEP